MAVHINSQDGYMAIHCEHNLLQYTLLPSDITQLSLVPTCDQLTSIDVSKNELTSLPEALSQLRALESLNASDNKLTKLPLGYVHTSYTSTQ